ncbi:MAG TPA: hypothetical protein VNL16_12965 [Chloroflexota bacterium]|nr:hypothetical protein [Chloroflexota bacterium]
MSGLALTLVTKDYDYLAPLACGDVVAAGLDLKLDRDTSGALDRTLADSSIQAGELSLSRHVVRLSEGDRSFVGVPFFAYRAFRQRCFFVRRDSGLRDFKDLAGRRVGTNEWPATGNTWGRAVLREQGVRIDRLRWWVGSVDGAPSGRSQGTLPAYVQTASPDRPLRDMLLEGELDALVCPWPPKGFDEPGSPIVRLVPDYRTAEQDYYRRTGIYPAHHLFGVRKELYDRAPWVVRGLYLALEQSKTVWQTSRRQLAESTPWTLADIEDATALIGHDWHANGFAANRKMLQAFCDEQLAQGLTAKPFDITTIFSEFDAVTKQ